MWRTLLQNTLTVLRIDASIRADRSITRNLANRFEEKWAAKRPNDRFIRRDLALAPPPHIDQAFIAAAFLPPRERDMSAATALAYSDRAIAEIRAADLIIMGAPMYNYGLPSTLKAWFDHVIRVDELFSFDLARGDWPLRPMLSGKYLVVLSARGEFGFASGGVRARLNHLDPHLETLSPFLGVGRRNFHTINVEYQEFEDERFAASVDQAKLRVDSLVEVLAAEIRSRPGD